MAQADEKIGAVLVIGGGIGGIQASLDLADSGFKVYLVESSSSIGGRMSQLDKTFPTNDCSMCILGPKMSDCFRHPNISIITCAHLEDLKGKAGNFQAKIIKKPRYVLEDKCNSCNKCSEVCPVEIPNEFDANLSKRKAIYLTSPQAVPNVFAIDSAGEPPCKVACPIGMNVQGYIALVRKGKFKEAVDLIYSENPFNAVCGRVCHHPCEDNCVRKEIDEPLAIASLKRFIADYRKGYLNESSKPLEKKWQERVAIIGSGPAGLTAAWALARYGYETTVFEALPVPGGMLSIGIPEFRLPREELIREIELIKNLGVEIKTNTKIGNNISIEDLFQNGYKAIFIAVGAQRDLRLNIPGEDLDGVLPCISFLRDVNLGREVKIGKRVAVIGGGNAALDAARTALRLDADEVTIIYRRTSNEMPADKREIAEALNEGVKIKFLAAPLEIIGDGKRVKGLKGINMELGEMDANGRRKPIPIPNSVFFMNFDTIIYAIGQTIDLGFLSKDKWSITEKNGLIRSDPNTLSTSLPGIFAGGDCISGPATVIDAISQGKKAAHSIHRYLRVEGVEDGERIELKEVQMAEVINRYEKISRKEMVKIPSLAYEKRRKSFSEVNLGYREEMAIREAERCLNCGICSKCLECEKVCESKAIVFKMKEEKIEINIGAVILSPGVEEFNANVKGEYGYGIYGNVITSLEFERILSSSGPYGGKIYRPSDKMVPHKIAFIQCVGSRDISKELGYCSAVCCMYAIKEAIVAKEKIERADVAIFFIDMRAFGKGFDRYYEEAKEKYGIRFIRSMVSKIWEIPGTKNLKIRYTSHNDKLIEEEFDLVILSTGLRPPKKFSQLFQKLSLQFNHYGFCKSKEISPVETSIPGIFVCGAIEEPKDIPETVMQASAASARVSSLLSRSRGSLVTEKIYPKEKEIEGKGIRTGIFICKCGSNIAGVIDTQDILRHSEKMPNVVWAEENLFLCSQEGQRRIKDVINEKELTRVVVASCTPRTHQVLFQEVLREAGLNKYLLEMANIRDQCSWVHMENPKEATLKARLQIEMANAKAGRLEPIYELTLDVVKRGLVIGGGITGMIAASSLADQGYETILLEKKEDLGGNLDDIYFTHGCNDVQSYLDSVRKKVLNNPLIHIFKKAELKEVTGRVGHFRTKVIIKNNNEETFEHGVIILATGGNEFKPEEYLYGFDERVITQKELGKEILNSEKIKKLKGVVMIQCVGSRDEKRPYCSRFCCTQAIKNALKIKEINPEIKIYILYRDIRTYGMKEDYYNKAREEGIFFIRYDPVEKPVIKNSPQLEVEIIDPILGEKFDLYPDLVVLSTGVVPNPDNEKLSSILKVPLNEDNFFLEAHLKLRPVDFTYPGIFLAGLAHSPKFLEESITQGLAAASRAGAILSKDKILIEGVVSYIEENICKGCQVCLKLCPFDAISYDGNKRVCRIDEYICQGCGTCAAACPSGANMVKNFKPSQILAQIENAF